MTKVDPAFGGAEAAKGFVYVLASEKVSCLKIGLTTDVPHRRIQAINSDQTYGPIGSWSLVDCRRVHDCRRVETLLHERFKESRVTDFARARELFAISKEDACNALAELPESELVGARPVSKLKTSPEILRYLHTLFRSSGLENFFGAQGRWTFTLYPSTGSGDRYFTLNIGAHEVAFSGGDGKYEYHSLVLDEAVLTDIAAISWLSSRGADISAAESRYERARPNSVSFIVRASTSEMDVFLRLPGVRRALLAYWYDYLLEMIENDRRSVYGRHHNYTAVSEIFRTIRLLHLYEKV